MGQADWKTTTPKAAAAPLSCPDPETNEKAEFGTLKHKVFASWRSTTPGGRHPGEAEVARVIDFANEIQGAISGCSYELTLKTEKIFGTLDWLGMNQERTHGIIIDAKFGAWTVTTARKNLQGWAYVSVSFQ